jgi:hypothetical protein
MNIKFLKNKFSWIFFSIYLLIGLFIFRDYGMSWDEEPNRIATALPEYNYVFHGEDQKLLESTEKYHGPSFELLLFFAEKMVSVNDTRSIYFLRHFLTFFFFWLSSLALFHLARKVLKEDRTAILCVLMYVLSPRIFGESFYNSKDIGLLSFFTLSLYTLQRFHSRKNIMNGLLHALITGFMIDIRITGILVPLITIFVFFLDLILDRNRGITKQLLIIAFYIFFQAAFIILFWPVLWMNPIHHLKEAFAQMSNFPWNGVMLFMGELIRPQQMPWYYLPIWMLISIPFLYTVLFLAGSIFLISGIAKSGLNFYRTHSFIFIAIALVLAPVIAVIVFGSVVYDGWRHLYFVYAPFVLVSGFGAAAIFKRIYHSLWLKEIFTGIFVIQFLYLVVILVMDHPHQNIYFNLYARTIFKPITMNFDADYWGLSYRKGLEEILAKDTASVIHLRVENDPGIFNLEMLKPEDRWRIELHGDIHAADYWLAEFRGRKIDPQKVNAVIDMQIKNSSGTLLTIYKGVRSSTPMKILSDTKINFDDTLRHENISSEKSLSGKFSEEINAASMSAQINIPADSLKEDEIAEYQFTANINSTALIPEVIMFIKVERNDSTIFWSNESLQNRICNPGAWLPFHWNLTMPPELIHAGDLVTAGVWNISQHKIFVDDLRLKVVRYTVGEKVNYFPE